MTNNHTVIGQGVMLGLMSYSAKLFEVLSKHGMHINEFIDGSGITPEDLTKYDAYIGSSSFAQLLYNGLTFSDNFLQLAWEFSQEMIKFPHGSLGLAINSAVSVENAFEIITTYISTQIPHMSLEVVIEENKVGFEITSTVFEDKRLYNASDLSTDLFSILTAMYTIDTIGRHRLLLEVAVLDPPLESMITDIYLNFPKPLDASMAGKPEYIHVHFSSKNNHRIMWPAYILAMPTATPDALFTQAALKQCEEKLNNIDLLINGAKKDVVHRVSSYLSQNIHELPSLELTAANLHMSPRTLKRQLKKAGMSFVDIKNDIRYFHASNLLLDDKAFTIENIAEKIGFSNGSNFAKAFKKWSGQTPKVYRDSQKRPI